MGQVGGEQPGGVQAQLARVDADEGQGAAQANGGQGSEHTREGDQQRTSPTCPAPLSSLPQNILEQQGWWMGHMIGGLHA